MGKLYQTVPDSSDSGFGFSKHFIVTNIYYESQYISSTQTGGNSQSRQSKMNSTKVSWIVFEDENTKTCQPSLDGRSSVSSLDNFDSFSLDLQVAGDSLNSRYSV